MRTSGSPWNIQDIFEMNTQVQLQWDAHTQESVGKAQRRGNGDAFALPAPQQHQLGKEISKATWLQE